MALLVEERYEQTVPLHWLPGICFSPCLCLRVLRKREKLRARSGLSGFAPDPPF